MLLTYRPEYQEAGPAYALQRDPARPAPSESAGELLNALLGDDPAWRAPWLLVKRRQPVLPRGDRPHLVDEGCWWASSDATGCAAVHATQIPPRPLDAGRAHRPARARDKRLLQFASVVGKDVPLPLLQEVADLLEEDLRRGLDHLQAAEFLFETRLFPTHEYSFKHALTHDVTYSSLLQDRRRTTTRGS